MIKRLISLLICIFLIFICVGCTAKQPTENNTSQDITQPPAATLPATQTPVPTITMSEEVQQESPEVTNTLRFVVLADRQLSISMIVASAYKQSILKAKPWIHFRYHDLLALIRLNIDHSRI